jgi:hypothetical protein
LSDMYNSPRYDKLQFRFAKVMHVHLCAT